MKFNAVINRLANFYFFIQNLSEWHFSNRKEYNVTWRKEMGQLSSGQENALREFRNIRAKYPSSKSVFEQAFFSAEPWGQLKTKINQDEYQKIESIFSQFEPSFDKLYQNDSSNLERWQSALRATLNDDKILHPIIEVLSVLYKTEPYDKEIAIYLLLSAGTTAGGGANIDEKSISLEVSRLPLSESARAMGIVFHEIIHLAFEKSYFLPLVKKYYHKHKGEIRINEIIAGALFPRGILAQQILGSSLGGESYFGKFNDKAGQIFSITQEYIEQKKNFDGSYIERISLIIEKEEVLPNTPLIN